MGGWGGSHLVLEVFDDLDEVRALLGQRAVLFCQHLVLHLHLPRTGHSAGSGCSAAPYGRDPTNNPYPDGAALPAPGSSSPPAPLCRV